MRHFNKETNSVMFFVMFKETYMVLTIFHKLVQKLVFEYVIFGLTMLIVHPWEQLVC